MVMTVEIADVDAERQRLRTKGSVVICQKRIPQAAAESVARRCSSAVMSYRTSPCSALDVGYADVRIRPHSPAARRRCSSRSISLARRAHSSKPVASSGFAAVGPCWERRTDGRTSYRFIDYAQHSIRAVPVMSN